MLIAEDIWVRHHRRSPWVLRGVTVRIEPGQVLGLAGPRGVGKSTLATVLCGMRTPDHGIVTVDGTPLSSPSRPTRPARAGRGRPGPVQLVGQRPELMMDPRWRIGRILAEAGPAGLGEEALVSPDWLERYPHELSSGELHRINLARAMRARPAYLIADEISSSLDALTQVQVWRDLLAWTARDGLGVLAISHDPALLAAVADTTVHLTPGDVRAPAERTGSGRRAG